MIYAINAPQRRRKKKRSAKQRAATRKMLAARKRKLGAKRAQPARRKSTRTTRRTSMARRKRRAAPKSRRRRRGTAKRRSGVRLVRRGMTVYQGNPRRRGRSRRRRGYSRNPAILAIIKQSAMDALATLGGGAVARMATNIIPLGPSTGLGGAAKGVGVAALIGLGARRFLSADVARFVTAGAMQVPVKTLITTFIPQAGGFLGDYDNMEAYVESGQGDYLQSGGFAGQEEEVYGSVEAYE